MRTLVISSLIMGLLVTPAAADERALSGFDSIVVSGNFRTQVSTADAFSVRVEGPDAQRIRTRVDGDTLRIDPVRRPWFGSPHFDATVTIAMPRLVSIAATRGAEVTANATGECNTFDATAAMGAQMEVSGLNCSAVDATAAMGANLALEGACERLDATAAMGGAVRAAGLHCRVADASAAMGGSIEAFASESYDASAAMGGDIDLKGGPTTGERSAVMGGSVRLSN
ncbi:MAG: DUF2807 domain-containing protein [Hyphomonadaceae bacterium]|nr:DUF2807 domain-containing protein [Hyphomonadaceae bacterium]